MYFQDCDDAGASLCGYCLEASMTDHRATAPLNCGVKSAMMVLSHSFKYADHVITIEV